MRTSIPPDRPKALSAYPYVVVRVRCDLCHRKGSYRLARLAATFGPEISLEALMDRLAIDCPYRADGRARKFPGKYDPGCRARYPDIDTLHPRPPDLPPGMSGLVVIPGGKAKPAAPPPAEDPPADRRRRRRPESGS